MRSVAGTALFAMGIAFDTMMDISRHSSARYSRGRRLCWPRRLSRADFVQYHRSQGHDEHVIDGRFRVKQADERVA